MCGLASADHSFKSEVPCVKDRREDFPGIGGESQQAVNQEEDGRATRPRFPGVRQNQGRPCRESSWRRA